MKKKIGITVTLAVFCFMALFTFKHNDILAAKNGVAKESEFNQYLAENMNYGCTIEDLYNAEGISNTQIENVTSDIFEVGKNIIILHSEIEQYEEYYRIADAEDPLGEAIKYAEQRNALYVEALKNGYQVTDVDIRDYIEDMRKSFVENMDPLEYNQLVENYGSEDAYWEFEYRVYTVDLPIQNYVHDLEMNFYESNKNTLESASNDAWIKEYETIKEKLVEEQNFRKN